MTTKHSMGYAGRCVGGPYDDQFMAHHSQRMVVKRYRPPALPVSDELGAYEWNYKYKAWDWVAYAVAAQESA